MIQVIYNFISIYKFMEENIEVEMIEFSMILHKFQSENRVKFEHMLSTILLLWSQLIYRDLINKN